VRKAGARWPRSLIATLMAKLIIKAGRTEKHYWADLWRYRELFYILAWRDVAVRYKQTAVGVAWAFLRPFLTMVIMTVIFGRVAGLPGVVDVPYPLLVFAAMLPWQFFSNAISASSESLVGNANLISKIYFPRLVVPGSSVAVSFIDFLISFALMAAMMVWYRYVPDWRVLTLPFFVALAFIAALGPGLLLTALTVRFRDVRFIIPFIVQFGLYVTPVGFSSTVIREKFGDTVFLLYSLNPMVGVIDGFRWALLHGAVTIHWPAFLVSIGFALLLLWGGVQFFRKTEKTFADVI
jgi:lipopolysaccharide transport system permease protein